MVIKASLGHPRTVLSKRRPTGASCALGNATSCDTESLYYFKANVDLCVCVCVCVCVCACVCVCVCNMPMYCLWCYRWVNVCVKGVYNIVC